MNSAEFGRIAAQTAKQVIIQKIREAERDIVFEDYLKRVGTITSGSGGQAGGVERRDILQPGDGCDYPRTLR